MHGWVNAFVGRLLIVAWAYGRLSHARGPTADRLTGFKPRQRPSRSTTNKKRTPTLKQPCIQSSIQPYVRTLTRHPSIIPSIYSIHLPIQLPHSHHLFLLLLHVHLILLVLLFLFLLFLFLLL